MRYKAFDPNSEVQGLVLLNFLTNIMSDKVIPILHKNGLEQVNPDTWYPVQTWLNVLSDLSETNGPWESLVAIGMKVGENTANQAVKPSFEEFMINFNAPHAAFHRHGDVGEFQIEKVNNRHFKLTARVPYPDDLGYGVVYGAARCLLPAATSFNVWYDEEVTRRDLGGEITVFHVAW
jgi:hypothetical protein